MLTLCILGVTGLVSTDEKNDRNVDVDLWTMTNQETGEYGVSHLLSHKIVIDFQAFLAYNV